MANTYQGPAVIVVEGSDFPVTANLSTQARLEPAAVEPWGGMLKAGQELKGFGPAEIHSGTIRMPDTRERGFLVTDGTLRSGSCEIRGIGPAPF